MKNMLAAVAAAAGFALGAAVPAHAQEEIQDFLDVPVKTKTGAAASPQEVRDAIAAAGAPLTWSFTDTGLGKLRGSLLVRGRHTIEVDILYAADRYSILYAGSREMRYQDSGGVRTIHPNYNVWVRQLLQGISTQLASLTPQPAVAIGSGDPAVEVTFWESVRSSTNPVELQAYLDLYPNGRFAVLARARLTSLGATPRAARPAAAAAATASPPRAAAPSGSKFPTAGDTWTYRLTEGSKRRQYTITVAEASDRTIVERFTIDHGRASRAEHPRGLYLMADAAPVVVSPYLQVLEDVSPRSRLGNVQLREGACSKFYICEGSVKALGEEMVSVPAGTFQAVKLLVEHSWRWADLSDRQAAGYAGARRLTIWYAPAAKRAVKVSSRMHFGVPGPVESNFDVVLDSYKLN